MHHPTGKISDTTAFVIPVVKHWLEHGIAPWSTMVIDPTTHLTAVVLQFTIYNSGSIALNHVIILSYLILSYLILSYLILFYLSSFIHSFIHLFIYLSVCPFVYLMWHSIHFINSSIGV